MIRQGRMDEDILCKMTKGYNL